jgi:hypothetical protein
MPYSPPSGNAVDLIFAAPAAPPSGGAVILDFSPSVGNSLTIFAQLEDVAGLIEILIGQPILISAQLEDVAGLIELAFDAGVFRGIEAGRTIRHIDNEQPVHRHVQDRFDQAGRLPGMLTQAWEVARPLTESKPSGWTEVPKRRVGAGSGWDRIPAKPRETSGPYRASPRRELSEIAPWQVGMKLFHSAQSIYSSPPARHRPLSIDSEDARRLAIELIHLFGVAEHKHRPYFTLPWQTADPHRWIWGGWFYPKPPPGIPVIPPVDLVFYQRLEDYTGGAILEFGRPCWAWPLFGLTTAFSGVIIVIHTIHVIRLPDLVNVPVLSVSLQFDIDSWAWGVSLNLQSNNAISLLEPVGGEPRQVRIELDGLAFTALIESWSENRQFGETTYTATGRSVLALFVQPYAPIRSYLEESQKTAAQLIDHELLNTGWSAAYHPDLAQLFTTDWLVPAGAWSYQNKSPVDAIVQIAQAIGARAYSDRNNEIVHIAPRYPVSPWAWAEATPDKSISLGLVRSISTQLTTQPDYNQVYVSGQNQGVLVSATRQGTAGDIPAPMATDPLITFVNAGRERARTILANTGRQSRVTLDLPLNNTTGLLEPGQLVEVVEPVPWRGLVTGIHVQANHGTIAQQVELERHYG